jgi:hypothetical protein
MLWLCLDVYNPNIKENIQKHEGNTHSACLCIVSSQLGELVTKAQNMH